MTKKYTIEINAPKEKVWKSLWDDKSYRQWTSHFSPGSYAETDWREGSKILFLDGSGGGMYSQIHRKKENELMIFKHIGEVKNGVEQPIDDKTALWSGAEEKYVLEESNGKTTVSVEVQFSEDYGDFFDKTFPLALGELKKISES